MTVDGAHDELANGGKWKELEIKQRFSNIFSLVISAQRFPESKTSQQLLDRLSRQLGEDGILSRFSRLQLRATQGETFQKNLFPFGVLML